MFGSISSQYKPKIGIFLTSLCKSVQPRDRIHFLFLLRLGIKIFHPISSIVQYCRFCINHVQKFKAEFHVYEYRNYKHADFLDILNICLLWCNTRIALSLENVQSLFPKLNKFVLNLIAFSEKIQINRIYMFRICIGLTYRFCSYIYSNSNFRVLAPAGRTRSILKVHYHELVY